MANYVPASGLGLFFVTTIRNISTAKKKKRLQSTIFLQQKSFKIAVPNRGLQLLKLSRRISATREDTQNKI